MNAWAELTTSASSPTLIVNNMTMRPFDATFAVHNGSTTPANVTFTESLGGGDKEKASNLFVAAGSVAFATAAVDAGGLHAHADVSDVSVRLQAVK